MNDGTHWHFPSRISLETPQHIRNLHRTERLGSTYPQVNFQPSQGQHTFLLQVGKSPVARDCVVELVGLEPTTRVLWNVGDVRPAHVVEHQVPTAIPHRSWEAALTGAEAPSGGAVWGEERCRRAGNTGTSHAA
jgi:hypothetical protein